MIRYLATVAFAAGTIVSFAAEPEMTATNAVTPRQTNKAAVAEIHESRVAKYKDNPDIMVRPGLIADRKEKYVEIQAEAMALQQHTPAEFLLIDQSSGHDYESLAVSFAKPSHVHEALEFIGMKPGRPVDHDRLLFWPKGERVTAVAKWVPPGKSEPVTVPTESLVLNKKLNRTLPSDGLVFVGSARRTALDDTNKIVYAADEFEPKAIVCHYNDFETVLDVPRYAPQGAVYDSQVPNPEYGFGTNQLFVVRLEPEFKDGRKRVMELALRIQPPAEGAPASGSNVVFRLEDSEGNCLNNGTRPLDFIAAVEKLAGEKRDPFVTVEFAPELPLSLVREVSTLLAAVDKDSGLHIDAPSGRQIYYKAFLPDESLRKREDRFNQPWELKITEEKGGISAKLVLEQDQYNKETDRWEKDVREYDASTPEALAGVLLSRRDDGRFLGPSGVFVFVSGKTSYGTLTSLISHRVGTRPPFFYHVYLD